MLTLPCGSRTIRPDYKEGSAGHVIVLDPYACLEEWEKRGKDRDIKAVCRARILAFMAGVEAEKELLGLSDNTEFGDADDRAEIEGMAVELSRDADWEKVEPRLRALSRVLVRRHAALIELTAIALLKCETLSAEALDKIISRSVNDIKVNAP